MRGGRALIFVDPQAEILADADPTGLGIGAAAASSTLAAAVRRVGRHLRYVGASSPTTATRSVSAGGFQPDSPHRPARPRRRGHEPGRPDHLGVEHRQLRGRGAFRARRRRDGEADAVAHVERRVRGHAGGAVPIPAGSRGAIERLHAERQGVRPRGAPRRAAEIGVPGRRADGRGPRSARRRGARGRALSVDRERATSCSSATSTS